jgi:hypothetical protein
MGLFFLFVVESHTFVLFVNVPSFIFKADPDGCKT